MFKVDAFVYFLINLAQLLVDAFVYIHYNKQGYLQRITYDGFSARLNLPRKFGIHCKMFRRKPNRS